jgi:hypothetical protein
MGFLEAIFGPSRDQVWAELCAQIDGEMVGGGWRGSKVQARVKQWIVTLDTYTVSSGKHSTTYTRFRAPFLNRDQFRFNIYRAGLFTELGKLFGLQDLEIGEPFFDQTFVVQANSEAKVRALLANARIRELLDAQPAIGKFTIWDDEGWFTSSGYPEGVDVLYFQVVGVIKEVPRLKDLYDLFAEVLNHLCHLDSAYLDDVHLHLNALRAPGGQIYSDKVLLWDGDPPRAVAAQSLGRLRARVAVPELVDALEARDPYLRANAAWALGEIGDAAAVPGLIPLLGEELPPGHPPLSVHAAAALRQLGYGRLVDAFDAVLRGGGHGIETLRRHRGPELTKALDRVLESSDPFRMAQSAWAAAELGLVELLPRVRARRQDVRRSAAPSQLEQLAEAIRRLEEHSKLPRPAGAPTANVSELPGASQGPKS